jgi:alkanesulfonate monooxygenase SsuD/methylene tetrahydromethanopterin reductase-like flavin-dependent oxidoreductase (luciferase family)
MAVELGVFVVPDARDHERTVEQVLAAEAAGLDQVGIQDHPYQRRFLDTWTLLAFLAARTERIRLVPDVINLPLRPPAVLGKAAASLDLLSGGRLELGLGAGGFWDAIETFGGPRRSGPESVDALEEAIAVLRAVWSGVGDVEGRHYGLRGAKPGPAPAHRIGIWLGAYGPRMLRVTGRLADGWLPSAGYLPLAEARERQQAIDEAAARAGRDPSEIKRALNLTLAGEPAGWRDQVLSWAELGFESFMLGADDDGGDPVGLARRLGEDLAPQVREALT